MKKAIRPSQFCKARYVRLLALAAAPWIAGCGNDGPRERAPEPPDATGAEGRTESVAMVKARLQKRLDTYARSHEAMKALLEASNRPESIRVAARDLIDQAELMLDVFARIDTGCDTYLAKVRELTERLDAISAEALDADYVDGAALPEAGAGCRSMKGLFVGPAVILVRLRESELSEVRPELLGVARDSTETISEARAFLAGGLPAGASGNERRK